MQDVIFSLVGLMVLVGSGLLTPVLYKLTVTKLGQQKADMLFNFAFTAVQYAEQVAEGMPNDAKKSAALTVLRSLSDAHNLTIDPDSANAAIEAAVKSLKGNVAASIGELKPVDEVKQQ